MTRMHKRNVRQTWFYKVFVSFLDMKYCSPMHKKNISMRPPLNAVETKRAAGCDEESSIDRKQRGGQRGSSLRKVNVD